MRNINTSISKEKGKLDRFFSACIGAGRAGELLRFSVMAQLERAQRECPFRYIRFHGLFHEEMNVVRRNEAGELEFSFAYTDMLFDKLLSIGLRPVCELGLMPKVMASEEKTVFLWEMNVSMPRDMREWEALVSAFVRHVTVRYGEDEVKKWYFEVFKNFFKAKAIQVEFCQSFVISVCFTDELDLIQSIKKTVNNHISIN
jgi:xylan 1,4-beta-xylosidase